MSTALSGALGGALVVSAVLLIEYAVKRDKAGIAIFGGVFVVCVAAIGGWMIIGGVA